MKLNSPDFPVFNEVSEGAKVLIVQADGTVGLVDVSLIKPTVTEPPEEPTPTGLILAYASNGDTNGLFYHLGTNGKTTPFANPADNGIITATQSALHNGNPTFGARGMCDRANQVAHTPELADNWFQWTLPEGKSLVPSHFTLQARKDFNGYHATSFKLQARKLDTDNWTDLLVVANSGLNNASAYYSSAIAGITVSFRTFRLQSTQSGAHYFTASSAEIYGELIG